MVLVASRDSPPCPSTPGSFLAGNCGPCASAMGRADPHTVPLLRATHPAKEVNKGWDKLCDTILSFPF